MVNNGKKLKTKSKLILK